jgi:hypothetical protein
VFFGADHLDAEAHEIWPFEKMGEAPERASAPQDRRLSKLEAGGSDDTLLSSAVGQFQKFVAYLYRLRFPSKFDPFTEKLNSAFGFVHPPAFRSFSRHAGMAAKYR